MKVIKSLSIKLFLLLIFSPGIAYCIPAFPGAEGFGANTVGGRGGQIIKVTNLNNSGPGSFRTAVTTPGKRVVVFDVSGIINLKTDLTISTPYLTIAGQTSPGGIQVSGRAVLINTHDVIIQHMRFRVGSHEGTTQDDYDTLDSLKIIGNSEPAWWPNPAYNILIDHCSISWGVDEDFEVSLGATNITVQWSIISEGLANAGHRKSDHSKGFIIWGRIAKTPMKVSFHHNYLAHNIDRNPMISGSEVAPYPDVLLDAVNNVVYNFNGGLTMMSYGPAKVNWVHNYVKQGPKSVSHAYEAVYFPTSFPEDKPHIYVEGNIGSRRLTQSDPQWSVGLEWRNEILDTKFRAPSRWIAPSVKTAIASTSMANCVLSSVGATAPIRDSVDTRVLDDFSKGTGAFLNNVAYPDDFPTFSAPAPPTDSDNDGMADSWEVSKGLNTKSNDSALDRNNDGHTNIEEYLHYLSAKSYTFNGDCMPMPIPHINKLSTK